MQGTRLVCLRGPAGCGKTTAIKQVAALLPQGSCFVLFDCFGGGSYLFSDDRRHLPENAFLQIVNDLALTLKTPLFLPRGRRQPIDLRQFLKRVADSAAVVAAAQPDALVVLGIDAADNAMTAAGRESEEQELLTEMWRVTTLTDRVSFLNALGEVKLSPISEPSRAKTLRDALEADSPAVERWRADHLPRVIVRHFAGLARGLKWDDSSLPELLAASGVPAGDRLHVLTEGLEHSGLSLESRALHGVADLIVKDVPQPVAAAVLTWYVARLRARVTVEPSRVFDLDHIPTSTVDAAARFLFALLSDIDTCHSPGYPLVDRQR